jgi:glutathione S-transferase
MRLFITRPSPFARKAWAAMLELGLESRVELVTLPPRMPKVAKPDLEAINPLGKVPSLVTDDGTLIPDSRVIVRLFDEIAGGDLIPSGEDRWRALTLEALADGCIEAGIVLRVESLKDQAKQDPDEVVAYTGKIERAFDYIESRPDLLEYDFNIGQLTLACVADWLVFREIMPDPVPNRPAIAARLAALRERPSLLATRPTL